MPDKKVKAILFDLGETLLSFGRVDTTRLFYQGAKLSYDFLKSCGQPVGSFKYYCWRNMIALHVRRFISRIAKRDFNSLALLRWVGTKKGIKLDRLQWRNFAWLWYEPLSKIGRVEPKIKQTLTALKEMGLKLGIVSNTFVTGSSLDRHLEQVGILNFFPVRLYSYEFAFRKPDIQIFQAAVERIGEVPENIMFVGDRIKVDINPAVKIGMRAILKEAYTNIGKKIPKGILKINQLSELPPIIEKINGQTASVALSGTK